MREKKGSYNIKHQTQAVTKYNLDFFFFSFFQIKDFLGVFFFGGCLTLNQLNTTLNGSV